MPGVAAAGGAESLAGERPRRRTLELAGPAFIKWGQWAATRADVFPPDFCHEVAHLQARHTARADGLLRLPCALAPNPYLQNLPAPLPERTRAVAWSQREHGREALCVRRTV